MTENGGPSGSKRCKSKFWSFTSFETSPPEFNSLTDSYLIIGKETCPSSSRQHWQCYLVLKARQYFSYIKKRFPAAHIERSRGSPEENRSYCSKDGTFTEFGTLPSTGRGGGRFKDVLASAEAGDIESIKNSDPGLYIRYKKTLESLRLFDSTDLKGSCGCWISGPPRCGKDYAVHQRYGASLYVKNINKWWDSYEGESTVLISDAEPAHSSFLGYYLKIWADRYKFTAEIKGASMKIRPKFIVVTSNYTMQEVFYGKTLDALLSRFDQINMDPDPDTVRYVPRVVHEVSDRVLKLLENVPTEVPPQISSTVNQEAVPGPSGVQTKRKKNQKKPQPAVKLLQDHGYRSNSSRVESSSDSDFA